MNLPSSLTTKKCIPCESGMPPLSDKAIKDLLTQIDTWEVVEGKLVGRFEFKDFKESITFVNKVAELAERENHHPNIFIAWNKVKITLFTHAIRGLSENDFIMAAKIDKIANSKDQK